MKKLFLLLGCVFMFAGCKNSASVEGNWETRSLEINGTAQEICISEISFEKSTNGVYSINGNSGVNNFFGSVKINDADISVQDNMGSTKMAGEPKAMQFEDNFLQTLIEAASFRVFNESGSEFLEIKNKDGSRKIVFVKK